MTVPWNHAHPVPFYGARAFLEDGMRELIEQMRAYCRNGAKALGPLLDPSDSRRPLTIALGHMRKTRHAAMRGLSIASEAAEGDGEALAIIAAIRAHPKPQHVIGALQDAYASPRWGVTEGD